MPLKSLYFVTPVFCGNYILVITLQLCLPCAMITPGIIFSRAAVFGVLTYPGPGTARRRRHLLPSVLSPPSRSRRQLAVAGHGQRRHDHQRCRHRPAYEARFNSRPAPSFGTGSSARRRAHKQARYRQRLHRAGRKYLPLQQRPRRHSRPRPQRRCL